MASIAAVLSISKTVHAGPVPGAQDDDFDSMLASVAPTHEPAPLTSHHLNSAPIAAPKIAPAPVAKLPQHARRPRSAVKRAQPGVIAQDDPTPVRQDHPSKTQAAKQPEAAPAPASAPVPVMTQLGGSSELSIEDDESAEIAATVSNDLLQNKASPSASPIDVPSTNIASASRALPGNEPLPQSVTLKSAPFEIVADANARMSEQSAPMKGVALPGDVIDKIIAAAGDQSKRQVAPPQAVDAKAAANPASPQSIASLMSAARASVVIMPSPEPRVAANPDVKPDAKAPAAQSTSTGKADATQVVTHEQRIQPSQQAQTDDDSQGGKPAAHAPQDQAIKPDQSAAPSEKAAQTSYAPTTSNQVQQQAVVPGPSQIIATSPAAAAARAEPAPAQMPEAQPNVGAIAAAIAAKSALGSKTFEIRLDPPELGRVDVHMTVDNDGRVQAMVTADHPRTLDLLQRGSHDLERALKDAGLNLSNNSLNFSLKGEGRQGDGGGASMARTRSLTSAVVARAEAANASEINLSSANGRLDIRV